MKKKTISLLILLFAVAVGSMQLGYKRQPDSDYLDQITDMMKAPVNWQGKFAPDFELKTLDGKAFKLSEHVGKEIIILNFFATWCGPCKEEIPELNSFYAKYKDEPVVLIGVNASEKPDLVASFVQKVPIVFPVSIDDSHALQKKYGVTAFPTTVFIGVDGKVQLYEMGAIMNSEIAFKKLVEANLNAIKAGVVVSAEAYRKGAAQEKYSGVKMEKDDNDIVLEGRAKDIASKMDCPCGCSDKVIGCACKTAKDIKKKLKAGNFGNKTDADIIKELDAEFCVKGG